jgi:alkylated DNA repair protein alkB family protein 8
MITGFTLIENYITEYQEQELLNFIYTQPWSNLILTRRIQQYGFAYNYRSSTLEAAPPVPKLITSYLRDIDTTTGIVTPWSKNNTQILINEYEPPRGIAAHVDAKIFGEQVMSLSLASDVALTFARNNFSLDVFIPRRSLFILEKEARYLWTHAIKERKKDKCVNYFTSQTVKFTRNIRVSITIRTV